MKNNKGFTLVEIMIVVVIIGILATIAVPAFQKVQQNTYESAILNNLRVIAGAGQDYLLETGESRVNFSTLLSGGYIKDINSVKKESYTRLQVNDAGGTLSVTYRTSAGTNTITFEY